MEHGLFLNIIYLHCIVVKHISLCLLGAFEKLQKMTVSFYMSVLPSAWNSSAPTERIFTNLMFCWLCIVIYPYNKNQQDVLFTFNLLQSLTPTCFEQAYCSSSGGTTLYIQQLVYVMRLCWLAVGRIVMYLQSSTSWWWAVSLLETCRD